MGTGLTAHGLPWPDPTNPVRDGAAAIRALAEAIDPRVPYEVYAISGGWTTNQFGGIAITCPFNNVVLGVCQLRGTGSLAFHSSSGAPAGVYWTNLFNTADGSNVANTFVAVDMIIMGYRG